MSEVQAGCQTDGNGTGRVVEMSSFHPAESPNLPWPIRGKLWGRNQLLCVVIPNCERKEGSIIIAETDTTQGRPHAARIVKLSKWIAKPGDADFNPGLYELQQELDPEATGKFIENGPALLYHMDSAREWDFPEGIGRVRWALLEGKNTYFEYAPVSLKDDCGEKTRKAYEAFNAMVCDVKPIETDKGYGRVIVK